MRVRRGAVRQAALILIAEEPRNGYQIIRELKQRTEGNWAPSPGAIYPALSLLSEEGLIRPSGEDGKAYELTEEGHALVDQHSGPPPWEDIPNVFAADETLERAYGQLAVAVEAVMAVGEEELTAATIQALGDARRSIHRLLAEH